MIDAIYVLMPETQLGFRLTVYWKCAVVSYQWFKRV